MEDAPSKIKRIAILGAGSWGSTLSFALACAGKDVVIWTRDESKAERINSRHEVMHPLKVQLPDSVRAFSDLASCLENIDAILFCCTSQSLRQVAERVNDVFSASKRSHPTILISAAKGLELSTLKRMSEVLSEVVPGHPICALSGPNLANEMLAGLPTAAVVASSSKTIAARVQEALTVPSFRVYSNDDLAGVELGGTLKNIIAIAAGASDGLNLGCNAKAALLTRGLAEMTRLATRLGANPLTLAGLSGMGDLFATCSGPSSRNYRLGMELAKGRALKEVLDELEVAVEGVPTTEAVCELSKRLDLELPIAEQVEATLKGKSRPKEAIMALMKRRLASEY